MIVSCLTTTLEDNNMAVLDIVSNVNLKIQFIIIIRLVLQLALIT